MKRFLLIAVVVGFSTMTTSANAALVGSPNSMQQHYKFGVYAPGPITPTPISGRQVCRTVQTVVGVTGLWQAIGNKLPIWITIPIYGTSVVCTYIYY
jgi:hypothetical protein